MKPSIWLVGAVTAVMACGPGEAGGLDEAAQVEADIHDGTNDYNHPSVVALLNASGEAWCTGVVVSRFSVLTAAHCADEVAQVSFDRIATATDAIAIVDRRRPPSFVFANGPGDPAPDIAIVKLASPSPVAPLRLIRNHMTNGQLANRDLVMVGYGATDYDADGNPVGVGKRRAGEAMRFIAVGPVTLPYETYDGDPYNGAWPVSEHKWHTNNLHTWIGNGDSGAPALGRFNGHLRVVGVAQTGNTPPDDPNVSATIFTRVDKPEQPFIYQTITAFEPNNPCRANDYCNTYCPAAGSGRDPDCF